MERIKFVVTDWICERNAKKIIKTLSKTKGKVHLEVKVCKKRITYFLNSKKVFSRKLDIKGGVDEGRGKD